MIENNRLTVMGIITRAHVEGRSVGRSAKSPSGLGHVQFYNQSSSGASLMEDKLSVRRDLLIPSARRAFGDEEEDPEEAVPLLLRDNEELEDVGETEYITYGSSSVSSPTLVGVRWLFIAAFCLGEEGKKRKKNFEKRQSSSQGRHVYVQLYYPCSVSID